MYTLDYYDGSPLKCGVCGKPCIRHYADDVQNDIGFCCLKDKAEVIERFMSFVSPEPTSGCWLWTAQLSTSGYPRFCMYGEYQYGHRASYRLFRGEIPSGLTIDHLCRVKGCVNPDHLEAVSLRENILRSFAANREEVGIDHSPWTHCQKGHELTEQNTYLVGAERRCRECGRERHRKWWARHRAKVQCLPTEAELADERINLLAMAIGVFVACSITFLIGCQVGAL